MLEKTKQKDIPVVLDLYQQAIEDLASACIDQWQNNYPNQHSLQHDIDQGFSYVFTQLDHVVATCALIGGGDRDYIDIHHGQWLNDDEYLTIHRIVVDRLYKKTGTSHKLMQAIIAFAKENNLKNIRVDTHQDNLAMQGFLKKEGFVYCGVVYIRQQDKRLAYQLVL